MKKQEKFFIRKGFLFNGKPIYETFYGTVPKFFSMGEVYFDLLKAFEKESKNRMFGGYV